MPETGRATGFVTGVVFLAVVALAWWLLAGWTFGQQVVRISGPVDVNYTGGTSTWANGANTANWAKVSANATNAEYATSAGTSATATNALQLGGVAASAYVTNGQVGVFFSGTTAVTNLNVNGYLDVNSTNYSSALGLGLISDFHYEGDTDAWIRVTAGKTRDHRAYLTWSRYDDGPYQWVMGRDHMTNFVLFSTMSSSHHFYAEPYGDTHVQSASNGWLKFNSMANQGSTNGIICYSGGPTPTEAQKFAANGGITGSTLNLTNASGLAVNVIEGGTHFTRTVWLANQRWSTSDDGVNAVLKAAGSSGFRFSPNYDDAVQNCTYLTADYKLGLGTNVPGARLDVVGSAIIRTNLTVYGTATVLGDGGNVVTNGATVTNALQLGGIVAASYPTNNAAGVSFSGTTTLTNLQVNGAITVRGGGNVVTNGGNLAGCTNLSLTGLATNGYAAGDTLRFDGTNWGAYSVWNSVSNTVGADYELPLTYTNGTIMVADLSSIVPPGTRYVHCLARAGTYVAGNTISIMPVSNTTTRVVVRARCNVAGIVNQAQGVIPIGADRKIYYNTSNHYNDSGFACIVGWGP